MAKLNRKRFERELKKRFHQESNGYTPLQISDLRFEPKTDEASSFRPDFVVTIAWQEKQVRFVGEIKTRSSPREVKDALLHLKAQSENRIGETSDPLLAVPYLSSSIVELLEETEISGLDLNGNYLLQAEDLVAIRLDRENKYKESEGIKNVFRGTSSIVCRYLLQEPGPHQSVTRIYEEIQNLGGSVSLSTVSKVLSTLDDELIIEKKETIRVLQPKKLLNRLREEYRPPRSDLSVRLKLPRDRSRREEIITELLGNTIWVWSGETSAERYAATTPSQEDEAFTRKIPSGHERLKEHENERFYNCILRETQEDFVYFGHDNHWASEIQTYLSLSQGDKREREISFDIEDKILSPFQDEHA